MVDREFLEDELGIDWDYLLDNIPDDLNFGLCDRPLAAGLSTSNSGFSLSIDDIEQFLINENFSHPEEKDEKTKADGVLSDVLLHSSAGSGSDGYKESSTSPGSAVIETDEEKEKQEHKRQQNDADFPQSKENKIVHNLDDDDDDPVAKKRKRQMRNRDAAVRSRERKKMYVRDLEMKSKYFEAECKRLGYMLQCCLAENQALRLSVHNSKTIDASTTKQESAVLLLESLLLGSLLGFLGIICLFMLPSQLLSTMEAGLLEIVDSAEWESLAPGKAECNVFRVVFHSFMMGKGCKASRSRMKLRLSSTEVLGRDF